MYIRNLPFRVSGGGGCQATKISCELIAYAAVIRGAPDGADTKQKLMINYKIKGAPYLIILLVVFMTTGTSVKEEKFAILDTLYSVGHIIFLQSESIIHQPDYCIIVSPLDKPRCFWGKQLQICLNKKKSTCTVRLHVVNNG